ncbi:hypothetical protein TUM19329_17400 [Legionella antarctica]|uniref:Protein kinase domain-containing protein n=2 Tax=Legionella antarctica TaxID=2708020 RepID=A0A6F8T4K5_9GAMM|nr:hypothetical protein TUM19329_17400 [Legionella antarctica]
MLGSQVYKGYQCRLKTVPKNLAPQRVKKEDIIIDETHPVAIKIYNKGQHPSLYQFYVSEIAVLNIEGQEALIMDFIDGFHIYPNASENPQLRQLTFFQAADVAWQLILGLNRMHYRNTSGPSIVHGDIKGENIKIRIKEIDVSGAKQCKIDALYLDPDYAKPIVEYPQFSQGTLEHLAIEALDGYYSEASDFFALTPILFSLFGASNPLRKIIEFRNAHTHLNMEELVKQYREIDFCSEGLFEHFEKKPDPFVCDIVERFITQMGAKYRKDRPSPEAILEFFTALRQITLNNLSIEDSNICLLRLRIAAKDEIGLKEPTSQIIFNHLDESLQHRLVNLMDLSQLAYLYRTSQENKASSSLVAALRKNIADHLIEESYSLEQPSLLGSLFCDPVTPKEISWLRQCFVDNNYTEFYSPAKEKTRKKIVNCKDNSLALLISIAVEDLSKALELSKLAQNSNGI